MDEETAADTVADAIMRDKKRPGEVTLIPMEVLVRRDLSVGAKCALAAVFYITQRKDIKGDLIDVVPMLIGVSREKALKFLKELESAKIIKRHSDDQEKAS